jgi:hypothetical protein
VALSEMAIGYSETTEPEAQSTITPPSGGQTAAACSDPDPDPDKNSADVSEIEMIPLSTP